VRGNTTNAPNRAFLKTSGGNCFLAITLQDRAFVVVCVVQNYGKNFYTERKLKGREVSCINHQQN
jgi:hypothetical protein